MENLNRVYRYCVLVLKNRFSKISADTLGWLTNIALHCATLPTFLALMTGISDKTPPVDIVMMLWAALALLFFRAVLLKDLLNIVTIGVGFMFQAMALILIFFK
jgi:hypothetical protein